LVVGKRHQRHIHLQRGRRYRPVRHRTKLSGLLEQRPAGAGRAHRLRVRGAPGGDGGLRHSGRHHSRPHGGVGLRGGLRSGPGPAREHGPGCVRGLRHPDTHGGPGRAARRSESLADGRAPDADPRAHHPRLPGRGDVRVAQDARSVADSRGQRRRLRRDAVRGFERCRPRRSDARGPASGNRRGDRGCGAARVLAPARGVALPQRAPRGGEGVLRAPTPRQDSVCVVAVYRPGGGAPHLAAARHQRRPEVRRRASQLLQRGGEPAGHGSRAVAGVAREGHPPTPGGGRGGSLPCPVPDQLADGGRQPHPDRRHHRARRAGGPRTRASRAGP
jgi:hypothetical protein